MNYDDVEQKKKNSRIWKERRNSKAWAEENWAAVCMCMYLVNRGGNKK